MILYLDTSALVKAYISEHNSREVLNAIKNANIIATHIIAFVEAHAAFSRLKREKKMREKDFESTKTAFSRDWKNYLQIENSQQLIERAADFTEAFALRAYDSIHLAAADLMTKQSKSPVTFACFDLQLNKAAKILGLDLLLSK